MSLSNHGNTSPGNLGNDSPQKEYFYALRFEQVVKEGVGKVALNSIFGNFLRQMQKHAPQPISVSDTHDVAVDFLNPMPEEGFKERFSVEVAEGKKKKLVILGFHLATKTPLSTLKKNMFDYLQKHGMFVRPHAGGFTNGVKTFYLGYIGKENPATADTNELVAKINKAMDNYWNDDTKWTEETRTSFKTDYANAMSNKGPAIPILVTRAKHKKVNADVLQVTVPSSHALPAKRLIDGAFLNPTTMPEGFVPHGLRREDPKLYYELVRDQAKWLHHHRNVQVQNVPPTEASELKRFLESKKNKAIHRIYIDHHRHRLHVSTTDMNFSDVQKWVNAQVKTLPLTYSPVVPTGKGAQSASGSIYSKMFTTRPTLSDDSYDSTIQTAKPNAWYKGSQVPLVIDFSADAERFLPYQISGQQTRTTHPRRHPKSPSLTKQQSRLQ